jgi:hypothetical protein
VALDFKSFPSYLFFDARLPLSRIDFLVCLKLFNVFFSDRILVAFEREVSRY